MGHIAGCLLARNVVIETRLLTDNAKPSDEEMQIVVKDRGIQEEFCQCLLISIIMICSCYYLGVQFYF